MQLFIVSIFDTAVSAFGRPAFVPSFGFAIRSFCDEVNRDHPDNIMFHHPEHFELYDIGAFDDSSGTFTTSVPRSIHLAADAKIRA